MKNIKALAKGSINLMYNGHDHDGLCKVLIAAFPLSEQDIPELKPCLIYSKGIEWRIFSTIEKTSLSLPLEDFLEELDSEEHPEIQAIAIALLPQLIERERLSLDHEQIVAQAYKFAKEVVKQGALKKEH